MQSSFTNRKNRTLIKESGKCIMGIFNIKNAGKKVKGIAKIMFLVDLALTCIIAVLEGDALPDRLEIVVPLLIIIVGIVISYISYILVFAFGDLVENSKIIKEQMNKIDS